MAKAATQSNSEKARTCIMVPANGATLGKFVSIDDIAKMLNEVNATCCVLRRSCAAEVAKGKNFGPFEEPRQHQGDPEFYAGVAGQEYPVEVREALVAFSRNHCVRQLLRAGEILDSMMGVNGECLSCKVELAPAVTAPAKPTRKKSVSKPRPSPVPPAMAANRM